VIPRGVWPVMATPFTDEGAIDWDGLDQMVESCVRHKYPASSKYFQSFPNLNVGGFSRWRPVEFNEDDRCIFSA